MKSSRVASFVLLLIAGHAVFGPRGEACGDKFVRVGRGGRFQRGYVAVYPATILVFVNTTSAGAASMQRLPATLKAAGHKARAVASADAFAHALKAERFDLVMVEEAEMPQLAAAIDAAVPHPEVLPILRRPTRAQVEAAARKQAHACIVDADKKREVLMEVDEVMGATRN
jgi:hypothetical protein